MKKHLLRILAAALALSVCFALSGCDILVPIAGEYRILSINDVAVNRFFAEGSEEGAAFAEMLGFGEETGYDGPANETVTITLESGGTGYVTFLGFLTYAVWSEAGDVVTVNCETGEVLTLERIPGSSAMTWRTNGYSVLFSRM